MVNDPISRVKTISAGWQSGILVLLSAMGTRTRGSEDLQIGKGSGMT